MNLFTAFARWFRRNDRHFDCADEDSPDTPEELLNDKALMAVERLLWGRWRAPHKGEERTLSFGPFKEGVAVETKDGALFWYKLDTLYVVNEAAHRVARRLPQSPPDIAPDAAHNATQGQTWMTLGYEPIFLGPCVVFSPYHWFRRRLSKEAREARHLVRQVEETYANLRAYQDSGEFVCTYRGSEGELLRRETFRTCFNRPDRFDYECEVTVTSFGKTEHEQGWIHADGSTVRYWDSRDGNVEERLSLRGAIRRGFYRFGVGSVVFPLVVGMSDISELFSFNLPARLPDAELDGVPCARIQGRMIDGSSSILWLDLKTHLVCGFDSTSGKADAPCVTQLRIVPEVDFPSA